MNTAIVNVLNDFFRDLECFPEVLQSPALLQTIANYRNIFNYNIQLEAAKDNLTSFKAAIEKYLLETQNYHLRAVNENQSYAIMNTYLPFMTDNLNRRLENYRVADELRKDVHKLRQEAAEAENTMNEKMHESERKLRNYKVGCAGAKIACKYKKMEVNSLKRKVAKLEGREHKFEKELREKEEKIEDYRSECAAAYKIPEEVYSRKRRVAEPESLSLPCLSPSVSNNPMVNLNSFAEMLKINGKQRTEFNKLHERITEAEKKIKGQEHEFGKKLSDKEEEVASLKRKVAQLEAIPKSQCPICYSEYGNGLTPLVGTCGHSICEVCCPRLEFERCPFCKKALSFLDPSKNYLAVDLLPQGTGGDA